MAQNKEELVVELNELLEKSREISNGKFLPFAAKHELQLVRLKLINLLDVLTH